MTREEALLHFANNYAKEALEKNEEEFSKEFEKYKSWFQEILIMNIEEICSKIRKKQELDDYKIMYFNFSLLRTSVISSEYTILLSAYNESWYLDDQASHINISIAPILSGLDNLRNYLEEKRKVYMGKVQPFDVEEILLEQAFKYYAVLELFAIKVFQNIDERECFKEVNKTKEHFIRWGEYRDTSYIVYKMDESEKSQEEFISVLKETEEENKRDSLMFSSWKNLKIQELSLSGINLVFSNFKNSKFKTITMEGAILVGGNFKNANLKECDFFNSSLEDASFHGAKLEEVSFNNTILKGVDFTYAEFKEVAFENSNLEGAYFLKKDIPFVHLSPLQLQTVVIKEE